MKFELTLADDRRLQRIAIEAPDEGSARLHPLPPGMVLLQVRALGLGLFSGASARKSRLRLAPFTQALHTLMDAGLGLVEALEAMLQRQPDGHERGVITRLLSRLREGVSFSDALADHPGDFPPLQVALVRAGEHTGELARVLERQAVHLARFATARRRLLAAVLYPALLLAVGVLVLLFLVAFVVPRFRTLYETTGVPMPWISRRMLDLGTLLAGHPWLSLAATAAAALAAWRAVGSAAFREAFMRRVERSRLSGRALRAWYASRLFGTLGLLLAGGVPLVEAVRLAGATLPDQRSAAIERVTGGLLEGRRLSDCLAAQDLADDTSLRLLRVGEQSGDMAGMLERMARLHESELDLALEVFSRLVEPVIMLVIGLVIGGVVAVLYLPIFDIASSAG